MESRILQLIAALRASGVRVSLAESAEAFSAVDLMGIKDREHFRLSLRATLIKDVKDLPTFEKLFPLFFGSGQPPMMGGNPMDDLTPEEIQMLAEALKQFTESLRQRMERLMNGEQARHPRSLGVGAPDQMPRALGGDHCHIDVLRRDDLAEMDVESVGKQQRVAGIEVALHRLGVDGPHHLVGHEHHDGVRPLGRGVWCQHPKPFAFGLGPTRRPLSESHHDVDPGFLQVEGMGVALAPVADDGHFPGSDEVGIAVGVVIDGCHARIVVVFAFGKNSAS